jgi:RHS repeat-associated protein
MMKNKSGTIYAAFVVSQTDYLAYGQAMPDRSFNTTALRYSFNGKEDEIFSEWQDYGFRNYDKKQRRFTSVDPLTAKYPWYTPYQFAGNKVIQAVDLDGAEEGFAISFERDQDAYLNGTMTENEVRENHIARGMGAALGALIACEIFVTKGKMTRYLYSSVGRGANFIKNSTPAQSMLINAGAQLAIQTTKSVWSSDKGVADHLATGIVNIDLLDIGLAAFGGNFTKGALGSNLKIGTAGIVAAEFDISLGGGLSSYKLGIGSQKNDWAFGTDLVLGGLSGAKISGLGKGLFGEIAESTTKNLFAPLFGERFAKDPDGFKQKVTVQRGWGAWQISRQAGIPYEDFEKRIATPNNLKKNEKGDFIVHPNQELKVE